MEFSALSIAPGRPRAVLLNKTKYIMERPVARKSIVCTVDVLNGLLKVLCGQYFKCGA